MSNSGRCNDFLSPAVVYKHRQRDRRALRRRPFIMLLVGGFNFLFAGGDQKKLEQARGTLTGAIIGLVVIVSAYLILNTIGIFTGVTDVTKFRITVP